MIRCIMLYKNMFFCVGFGVVFLFVQVLLVSVVVVIFMKLLGFIVVVIVDGVIEIQVLLFDGVFEYDYFFCFFDVKCLQNVDLVVWIGLEMEVFMDKLM